MKHKHAEVLIAIAEGKDVQIKILGIWNDANTKFNPFTPINNPEFEWRIKSEPKPDVVSYICFDSYKYYEVEGVVICEEFKKLYDNNIKLIFDGETGKLKSAEVIK